jgi:hypothetical protein
MWEGGDMVEWSHFRRMVSEIAVRFSAIHSEMLSDKHYAELMDEDKNPLCHVYLTILFHSICKKRGYVSGDNVIESAKIIQNSIDEFRSESSLIPYLECKKQAGVKPQNKGFYKYMAFCSIALDIDPTLKQIPKISACLKNYDILKHETYEEHDKSVSITDVFGELDIDRSMERVPERLLGKGNSSALYYGYRYSSIPGYIARFGLTFEVKADRLRFTAIYPSPKGRKVTEGVALHAEGRTFLIGYNKAYGMKVLALNTNPEAEHYTGLIMTKISEGNLATGKVHLRRTDKIDELILGHIKPTDIAMAERTEILNEIKNRITFNLLDKITIDDQLGTALLSTVVDYGKLRKKRRFTEISQAEMVALTMNIIGDRKSPLFRIASEEGDTRPFNPAADEHYPYNQILIC